MQKRTGDFIMYISVHQVTIALYCIVRVTLL